MNITDLKGEVPAKADVLPLNYARAARNCDFRAGDLRPGKGTQHVMGIPKLGDIRTIHKLGDTWLYWLGKVDVARAVTSTDRKQIYYCGDGAPKITDESMATAGSPADYPAVTHRMGVPSPVAAPAVAISKIEPSEDYGDVIEPVAYIYTCLARVREGYIIEGGASPVSVVLEAKRNMRLTVSGFTPPEGVTHEGYRLYRMRAGSDAEFRAVPYGVDGDGKPVYDIPASETDFDDSDLSTNSVKLSLGEICESEKWEVFPDETTHLVEYQNSMVIGVVENEIIPSAPLYQYPAVISQALKTSREVVGACSFGDVAVFTTKGRPLVLSGTEPGFLMLSLLPFEQGCLSARGQVGVENGVYYPSPEGMVFCDGAQAAPVTKALWKKEQWEALHPEKMITLYHDAALYLFFEGESEGIVWDFRNEYVSIIDVGVPVYHGQVVDDELYLLVYSDGYSIVRLFGTQDYSWETSWTTDNRPSPAMIRFDGDFSAGSVTVTIDTDGNTFSRVVSSTDPVKLKSRRGRKHTLRLEGNATIRGIELG